MPIREGADRYRSRRHAAGWWHRARHALAGRDDTAVKVRVDSSVHAESPAIRSPACRWWRRWRRRRTRSQLWPRPFPRDLWISLFKPGFGVPTDGAYCAYAALPPACKHGLEESTRWGRCRNDLEPAVFPKYLLLPVIKDWLRNQSETLFALMCGSGSTMFAIVHNQSNGEKLQARFRQEFGEQTWTAVCPLNPCV